MKETRFWVIVVPAIAVGILLWIFNPKIPDGVGSYVLLLTLVAVMLYTRETHKLRLLSARQIEVSQEQLELALMPHLEIIFKRAHFRLHNIGYGPASHVEIKDVKVAPPGITPRILRFICPPVIKKDESLPIEIEIRTHDGEDRSVDVLPGFFTPPLATETIKIRVHYENLKGRPYERELVIGKEMPIDNEPVDFLMQYLYEKDLTFINPNEIPALYVKPENREKLLRYCLDKKLATADIIEENGNIVDVDNLGITSDGIDYLKGKV